LAEEGPVQRRDPVQHHPGLVGVQVVVPGQHRVAEVAHHDDGHVALDPSVDDGVAHSGRQPVQDSAAQEQVLPAHRPSHQAQRDVRPRRHPLDHQPAPVGQPDPLQARA
jgi:hypothetical protein